MLRKVNDLSQSPLKRKFAAEEAASANNLTVVMGRVSTKRQKGEAHFSDQAQNETIEGYCQLKGLSIAKSWDVAESASNHEKRRHFHELIEFVRASQKTPQRIGNVVFSHQSRSNRNKQSARALEELIDLGVVIHFARDQRTLASRSDLAAWLVWHVENLQNESYIEQHRLNVWDGMLKRVELGLFPGKAPFGYRNHRPSEHDLSTFVFVEGPSAYMRKAFELFSSGAYSQIDLHAELDKSFPMTKKPDIKRLNELLKNPFYYGDFLFDGQLYHGNPDYHPPLISYDLWKRVQDMLLGRHRKRVTQKQHAYLGIIKCGGRLINEAGEEMDAVCGTAITAEEKRKRLADGTVKEFNYYHCSRNKVDGVCSQRDTGFMQTVGRRVNYTELEVELLFEAVFRPLNFTPEICTWMQDVLRKEHAENSRDHRVQLAALQDRHKMLERYIDKAYEDKLGGAISEELWRSQHGKWTQEREQVQRQITAICADKDDYIQNGVLLIELAQRTEHIYKNATADVKRKLVEIVSSNHVLRNGSISFDYRKPFDVLAKSHPKEKWWTRTGSNR